MQSKEKIILLMIKQNVTAYTWISPESVDNRLQKYRWKERAWKDFAQLEINHNVYQLLDDIELMMELAIIKENRDGDQLIYHFIDSWRQIIKMELKRSGLF